MPMVRWLASDEKQGPNTEKQVTNGTELLSSPQFPRIRSWPKLSRNGRKKLCFVWDYWFAQIEGRDEIRTMAATSVIVSADCVLR
jgi:hypothetical protein